MENKQNADKGLIIGIDITKYNVQVSCLPFREENAETLSTQMGVDKYEIPLCLFRKTESENWHYGEKAKQYMYSKEGIYVEDLWEGMLGNRELILEDEKYSYEKLMSIFLDKIMLLVSQNGYTQELAALVFTTEAMDAAKINGLRRVVKHLAVHKRNVFFIDYKESFAAYATNHKKDLWSHDVFLFHYEGRNLKAYQLRVNQKTLPFQMRVGETDFGEVEYSKDELEASQEARFEMDSRFEATVEEVFARKIVSSVYLIGDGFLPGWMKNSLRVLCRGRRVFQGNNLFTKGACYAGRWYLGQQKPAGEYNSNQMLMCDVRIPVEKNGEEKGFLTVANKGQLWYCAGIKAECIAEPVENMEDSEYDLYEIPLEIAGVYSNGEAFSRVELLELDQFPKRPRRASKIQIKVKFLDEHTGEILVKDMGFGEFYPSSGLTWEKTFSLGTKPEGHKEGGTLWAD